MKKFPVKPLALMVAALAVAPWSNSVLAQASDDDKKEGVEEVVVTGYALSIQNSIDIKRNADTVVQAISADDLGALPDASIADALGRVPGITITRSGGQAGTIQVRGMGEGFVFSTLNGREQVSPNGTRAMEFSQFPSELIQSVEVYMSPKASLIEGGVAGTVELKTANPLEMEDDQKVVLGVRGSFNDQADDIYGADPYGKRFSVSFQKKLFDDKLGLALGYARLVQPRSATRFEQYNYETTPYSLVKPDERLSTAIVDRDFNAVSTANRPASVFMAEGFEVFQTGGEETRDGYVAAVQFEPTENLSIQSDVFYSKFESDSYSRGFRVQPLRNAEIASMVLWNNTAVVGGEFKSNDKTPTALNLQINSNDVTQTNELLSGGLNLQWQQDALTASLDLSHSDASGEQADGVVRAYLYRPKSAATPNADPFERDPDQSVTYLLDGINVPSVSMSRDYTSYDSNGVSNVRLANYERYPRINDDVISAARFDVKYELEVPLISSVEAGVRYSERNHKDRRQVFVYGDGAATTIFTDWSLPITTENSDVVNWKGEFSHFPSFIAIDGDAIMKEAYDKGLVLGPVPEPTAANPKPVASARSIEPAARWGEGRDWSMKQRSDIDENITSFYLQANLATTLFDRDLIGNIGLRHVRTDQSSVSIVNVNGDESKGAIEICDEVGECKADFAYQTLGAKYDHNLPSLNLNYALSEDNSLRLALARVLSRPPINRLAAPDSEGTISIEGTTPYFNYGSNTSPFLTPFIADQVDISFEHYMPDTNGAFVVAVYHREIKSFIQDITYENFDFRAAGFDVPDTWEVVNNNTGGVIVEEDVQNGDYSTSINNSEGGYIRGLEISYTQTFNFLPDPWAGLGVSTSYSLTDSKISVVNPVESVQGSNNLPFPGLVEKSANFTLFYSYGAFETRLSTTYQDSFVGETRNVNLQPIVYAPETLLDYQASYKFDNGIDVIFSVTNLTNEPNRSYMFDEELTRTLQWFGRTFYVGANYTF
ncbi:TonB-dependent receptor [Cellvibrio mixtus]|uniref:TonB-dependent receptor n=1 Tax=Cellvibrio mixtus TaxID=39650 RepID=UPI000587E52D|nr:TonB-dependent receptor [Cellvibrio mixtus]